jgi:hypothetical protein
MIQRNGDVSRTMKAGVAMALGLSAMVAGCGVDYSAGEDAASDGDEATLDGTLASDGAIEDEESDAAAAELGTAQQGLWFSSPFSFKSSCSDPNGTNSVLAALAVATATELKRWQPRVDFEESFGVYRLTSTGKSQCADKVCWNTQAILALQNSPNGKVQVRPGVKLDTFALRLAISSADRSQFFSNLLSNVAAHKFQLMYTEPGGCDTYYWFNVTSPTGGTLVSSLISGLQKNLAWVGGTENPYIQFQSNGTMIGIDPTYGLNEVGAAAAGSCTAACTKMSSTSIAGQCCSCNGTKKFARSTWNATTYLCQ